MGQFVLLILLKSFDLRVRHKIGMDNFIQCVQNKEGHYGDLGNG